MAGKHNKAFAKFGNKKFVIMFAALTLVICTVVGGTLAWLITKTDPVVNTFTYGDINITLEETDTNKDGDNDPNTNTYEMVPGRVIAKDPRVTFKANSEDAWLFVKLEETTNFKDFMTYAMADGWTALNGVPGVYYREVAKSANDVVFTVLKGDTANPNGTVTVKGEVTKEQINALNANGASNYPKLIVTAYAVQRDGNIATAADAWAMISGNTNP